MRKWWWALGGLVALAAAAFALLLLLPKPAPIPFLAQYEPFDASSEELRGGGGIRQRVILQAYMLPIKIEDLDRILAKELPNFRAERYSGTVRYYKPDARSVSPGVDPYMYIALAYPEALVKRGADGKLGYETRKGWSSLYLYRTDLSLWEEVRGRLGLSR
jgi:hypothetical protein